MPPPLPAAPKRPGRVKVYSVIEPYIPEDNNGKELRVDEGDVLYISESDANDDFFEVTCGEKTGRLPASYGIRTCLGKENVCLVSVTSEKVLIVEFPLHEAAKRGNLAFLLDCLRNKVSPNSLDKSGSTALHWASHGGHVNVVVELLKIPGLTISSQNKLGDTPLHAASWKGHLECVRLLVDHDADVHVRNLEGKKPVDLAATPEIGAFLKVTMSKVAEPADLEDYGSSDDEECVHI
ncbi:SH3 domain-containing protein [Aphelenchoides avenae]|nr:SH3 domain-containing protein [Aphelenchus avenae]